MTAAEIALAFNTANTRKTWSARPYANNDIESVHFTTNTGLVTLIYTCADQRFAVRFNKFQAAWGDYVKAIARSLYIVLMTLKATGLPFEAPASIEGVSIIVTPGDGQTVYVRADF